MSTTLVAETGYSTYLLFGGGAVVFVLCAVAVAAVICRRLAFGKYDFQATPNGGAMANGGGGGYAVNRSGGGDDKSNGMMMHQETRQHQQGILKASGSNGQVRELPHKNMQARKIFKELFVFQVNHTVQEEGLYASGSNGHLPPQPSYHHHNGNGTYGRAGNGKRVTLNPRTSSAEEEAMAAMEEEECYAEGGGGAADVDAVMNELLMAEQEEDEMMMAAATMYHRPQAPPLRREPPRHPPRGQPLPPRRGDGRMRAPRELWLV